jgi:UDP-N-acetylmuramoyl-tripeptide--D-alanyl-D-alanine ligase
MPVRMRVYGLHNIYNALAAAAAATALGVAPEVIGTGLEAFTPVAKRFNLEEVGGIILIDDSYNANPASMAAALVTLRDISEESRAIAVLGDMLELGEGAAKAHRELGRLAATCVDRLYLLGGLAEKVAAGAMEGGLVADEVMVATGHGEILADLGRVLSKGDYLLVKGSRGMQMEKVAEGIRQKFGAGREGGVA